MLVLIGSNFVQKGQNKTKRAAMKQFCVFINGFSHRTQNIYKCRSVFIEHFDNALGVCLQLFLKTYDLSASVPPRVSVLSGAPATSV